MEKEAAGKCFRCLYDQSWTESWKQALYRRWSYEKEQVCLRWRMIFYEVCPWLWDWIPKSTSRGKSSSFERKSSVATAESSPIELLLQKSKEYQQSCIRWNSLGRNHRHFLRHPILRSSPIDRRIKTAWFQHQPQTGSPFAESVGIADDISRPHFNTSEPHPEHKKFPHLLKGLKIDHPNQVWSTDITYTAVDGHRAFVIGIVDWFSRKLVAYNGVNTMDALCGNVENGDRTLWKAGNL